MQILIFFFSPSLLMNGCLSNIQWRSTHVMSLYNPPLFRRTKHSPSLWKASRGNPCPNFSNCIQSDVSGVVLHDDFLQKKQLYTAILAPWLLGHQSQFAIKKLTMSWTDIVEQRVKKWVMDNFPFIWYKDFYNIYQDVT